MINPLARELLRVAEEIGTAAAAHLTALRPAGRVDVAYTKTSPTDAVTDLDRATEIFIRDRLLAVRPDDTIVGEEGDDHVGTSGVSWLVDPIDGTVNFVYGIPAYAISIGAAVDDEVVAGFVVNVVSGESWSAMAGAGWRGPDGHHQHGESWASSTGPAGGLAHALVATGFNYVPDVRARQAAAAAQLLPRIRDIRRLGSAALDLCALASGRIDAYVEEALQPWDLAAGALIAREAGIVVSGMAPDGTLGEPTARLTMAAHPAIAQEFFDLVLACGF